MKKKKRIPVEIIPTVVPDSLESVTNARARYESLTSMLHIDAADGVFAPNKTWIPSPEEKLPEVQNYLYEVHLMVEQPLSVGVAYARAGAQRIIGHLEAFEHAEKACDAFNMWRLSGAKEVGVAILMGTAIDMLAPYVGLCDEVLVMTIAEIGVQGIPFDERGISRVAEVRKRYPHVIIAVDGGVSEKNIAALANAGATRFGAGSVLAKSSNPAETFAALQAAA